MGEFKKVPMLRHDVIVQAIAYPHAIQIASPRFPGDGVITLTEAEGGVPALHAWLGRVLDLPDVTALLAVLEPIPDAMWEAQDHIEVRDVMGGRSASAQAIRAKLDELATALEAALKAAREREGKDNG